jgi:aryl-alcohol dehydrogenase-like predicted oxidoreductase
MHVWDMVTPVEEVLSTLNDLVRTGKIRHFGFSDVPAWYVARAQTLAEKEGKEGLIALQLEYSLVERDWDLSLESVGRRFLEWEIQAGRKYRKGRRTA